MRLYKLTDEHGCTKNATRWGEGVTHTLPSHDHPQLCSSSVLHAYQDADLGLLLNPIHGNITSPLLWEADGDVVIEDWGKVGCFSLTTTRHVPLPDWCDGGERERRTRLLFAILCAESVLAVFETAQPGDDRPRKAIDAAREYLNNPTRAAADAAAWAADAAADAAAWAGNTPRADFIALAHLAVIETEE